MCYFGLFGLCLTNLWVYSDAFFLGCLGCVEQIRGSIPMGYFGLFGFSLTSSLIYLDALFWVVRVEFNKFVDLFRCVILGFLGCCEQISGSIQMGYFGLFGFILTNLLIYSDGLFWVVWVEFNKFVDLFLCVILGCLDYVEQVRGSIRMCYFGLFGLC